MNGATRSEPERTGAAGLDCPPKLCGADVEFGNFMADFNGPGSSCAEASRRLLGEIRGVGSNGGWSSGGGGGGAWSSCGGLYDPYATPAADGYGAAPAGSQDWGRKFLPCNGGCVYIDLQHLEACLPEVSSAYDHLAAWGAMLRIVGEAMDRANAALPDERRIQVLANNSDGRGSSYGSHTNFLVSRRCWDNLFHRKIHHMLYLASYFASSIVFTGAGKVGSENGRNAVDYQVAQRADFFETLTGPQTTTRRPLVNSRDESLCGRGVRADEPGGDLARLHVIFFDNTLCDVSSFLKIGVTQVVLAMIEQEFVDPGLLLDDPLHAVVSWSHDPELHARARLSGGGAYTAVEVQSAVLDHARRFVESGRAEGVVPDAEQIVQRWAEVLEQLRARNFEALAGRLDWVLKRAILREGLDSRGLPWDGPEAKHLDHLYSSLDRRDGLFLAYEQAGLVEKLISPARVERFVHEPPEDTRAYLRAMLLRRLKPEAIDSIDWDRIRLRTPIRTGWPRRRYFELPMNDPSDFTRSRCEPLLEGEGSFVDALRELGLVEVLSGVGSGWSGVGSGQTPPPPQGAGGPIIVARRPAAEQEHPSEHEHGRSSDGEAL